jgi:hypothetical protein
MIGKRRSIGNEERRMEWRKSKLMRNRRTRSCESKKKGGGEEKE